jgi:Zn-dependent M16 (insulinase) family peptidase
MLRLFHSPNVPHFNLVREVSVEESRLQCVFYEHRATGAQIMHIAADDSNNFFACGFATQPGDSSGVAHILEHTVLCGSERFPVRDPFFNMMKRSLSTYMNALTGPDFTIYPFGSLNETDYHNLMQVFCLKPLPFQPLLTADTQVYLDAMFFPRLRRHDFLQEGHRLESDGMGGLMLKGAASMFSPVMTCNILKVLCSMR